MNLTRRHALGALLGTGLAALTRPNFAQAAAPIFGVQAPAFYRSKLGDLEITAISDGYGVYPKLEGFVKNASVDEVRATLAEQFLPTDRIQIPFTTLVVNTGKKLVMLDTGNGDLAAPTSGVWMKNFRAAGFKPEDVDVIVLSHFHGDHINGLRLKDGTAVFPNAEIKVHETELKFWTKDALVAGVPAITKNYADNVQRVFAPMMHNLTMYKWNDEVAPGITSIAAPGHTPGHSMFAIASGKERFMAVSDITNVPYLFARHPDWAVLFDNDPEQARATRHRVLDMLTAEKMQVGFYHGSFPAFGTVVRDGKGYNLAPGFWKAPV
jgi:glyoxylase-like metal-dependent hydrolase (beta-lactamase superfamily II)